MNKKEHTMDTFVEEPCDRCGSKKRIAKTWTEQIPTYSGSVDVEYTQVVCTNDECQAAFDKTLAIEAKKREEIRVKREENEKNRKANSLSQAVASRKAKKAE